MLPFLSALSRNAKKWTFSKLDPGSGFNLGYLCNAPPPLWILPSLAPLHWTELYTHRTITTQAGCITIPPHYVKLIYHNVWTSIFTLENDDSFRNPPPPPTLKDNHRVCDHNAMTAFWRQCSHKSKFPTTPLHIASFNFNKSIYKLDISGIITSTV